MKQQYVTPSIRTLPCQQIVEALGHATADYGTSIDGTKTPLPGGRGGRTA